MALDPSTLSQRMGQIFASHPESKEDAARQIAQAYFDYAQQGQFGASLPIILPVRRDAMASTLAAAFTVPGLPPIGANAFGAALTAFWAGVPIAGAQSGSVTSCPGAAAVPGQLVPLFLILDIDEETSGKALGLALHTATLTVITALAPPPAVVPIA